MHCLLTGRTAIAERVWDIQKILDWAEKLPEVDRLRMGMAGRSAGGVVTSYVAAIDTRIAAAVPACTFSSLTSPEGFIYHCDCCMVPGIRNWGDSAEIGGLTAPRPLLILHAERNGLHHRPDVERNAEATAKIYKAAGAERNVFLKWGDSWAQFYPELIWPFFDDKLKKR